MCVTIVSSEPSNFEYCIFFLLVAFCGIKRVCKSAVAGSLNHLEKCNCCLSGALNDNKTELFAVKIIIMIIISKTESKKMAVQQSSSNDGRWKTTDVMWIVEITAGHSIAHPWCTLWYVWTWTCSVLVSFRVKVSSTLALIHLLFHSSFALPFSLLQYNLFHYMCCATVPSSTKHQRQTVFMRICAEILFIVVLLQIVLPFISMHSTVFCGCGTVYLSVIVLYYAARRKQERERESVEGLRWAEWNDNDTQIWNLEYQSAAI